MRERVQRLTRIGIPDFPSDFVNIRSIAWKEAAYAVKSALPDAALEASGESFVLQTAPLWPRKVPIQSPVHSLNIGFPSLQLETNRNDPSS